MSRKDYILIAKAISDGKLINCPTLSDVETNRATCEKIARQLAGELGRENPRFNHATFLKACSVV